MILATHVSLKSVSPTQGIGFVPNINPNICNYVRHMVGLVTFWIEDWSIQLASLNLDPFSRSCLRKKNIIQEYIYNIILYAVNALKINQLETFHRGSETQLIHRSLNNNILVGKIKSGRSMEQIHDNIMSKRIAL